MKPHLLRFVLAAGLASLACANAPAAGKPPFHVIFSNDVTNLKSCPSPFNQGPAVDDPSMRALVDEAGHTGIEVHMLQPGLGWVPWWQSKVLPMAQHVEWLKRTGHRQPNAFEKYVLNGGDLVKVFVDECRQTGQHPFVSIRMNDLHHVFHSRRGSTPDARKKIMEDFQFFADHPEYRMGPGVIGDALLQNALDWRHPEVRGYKFRLIEELCENYDIDGLELDFMRFWYLFNPEHTPVAERKSVINEFVARVRKVLDRTAKDHRHRWLSVRISGYTETYDGIGIDLAGMAAAGVEMVNVSGHYFTDMQMNVEKIRNQLPPQVAVYDEVQYVIAAAPDRTENGKAVHVLRRTTAQQYYTTAYQAYARGANGVSAFNFHYYRGTFNPTDVWGPKAEPPYEVFKRLGDRAWLSYQPQHYVVGRVWNSPLVEGRPFQAKFKANQPQAVTLVMAPPKEGWKKPGRLRIQAGKSLGASRWKLSFNGEALAAAADVSEPYPNPYPVGLGEPQDYRAWSVPVRLMREGVNRIELTLVEGDPSQIFYLDLAVQ